MGIATISPSGPVQIQYVENASGAVTWAKPARASLRRVFVRNRTVNAITGGLKFGSTSGGADIVTALAIGANAIVDSATLLSLMGASSATVYVDAVVAWNSASVDIGFEFVTAF